MKRPTSIGFFVELRGVGERLAAAPRGKTEPRAVNYLRRGSVYAASPGRIVTPDGRALSSSSVRTDGVFMWPDELSVLVEDGFLLPKEFLEHMAALDWIPPQLNLEELIAIEVATTRTIAELDS